MAFSTHWAGLLNGPVGASECITTADTKNRGEAVYGAVFKPEPHETKSA